jgi:hypothetical protein
VLIVEVALVAGSVEVAVAAVLVVDAEAARATGERAAEELLRPPEW